MKTLLFLIIFLAACAQQDPIEDITKTIQQPQEIVYVALGDSYSLGYNSMSAGNESFLENSFATGDKIESIVEILKKEGYKVSAHNLAEPGATSEDVIKNQLSKAISLKPDFVTILLAGNDMRYNLTPVDLGNNLDFILKQLKGTDVIIGNVPNVVEMRKAEYDVCRIKFISLPDDDVMLEYGPMYNDAIVMAAKNNGIKVVDLYSNLGTEDVGEFDCVHLNPKGQEKVAQLFWNCWKKNEDCVEN